MKRGSVKNTKRRSVKIMKRGNVNNIKHRSVYLQLRNVYSQLRTVYLQLRNAFTELSLWGHRRETCKMAQNLVLLQSGDISDKRPIYICRPNRRFAKPPKPLIIRKS